MTAYLAPSLAALRSEADARWPNRDTASDGWIGDPAHAARVSDHNPDPDANDVVRALDLDDDGIDVDALLAAVIGDERVEYVIHNRTIWSRSRDWVPRPYTGSNAHTTHVHVSIRHTPAAEADTRPWLTPEEEDMPTAQEIADAILDSPLNLHDPKGLKPTQNITVREKMTSDVIEQLQGRAASRDYLRRAQRSRATANDGK